MIIPLEKRLRKRAQVELGMLQDEVMEILYGVENGLVLHGGTAIWRCYGGNRFSEDLDFYCVNIGNIEAGFRKKISERGLTVLKYKKTGNLLFCKISNGAVELRVEINFSATKPAIPTAYEKMDGNSMDVFTLPEDGLILEKISAYAGRKFIRDIYDIYHLSGRAENSAPVRKAMRDLLAHAPAPVDESNLKALVYSGAVPSFSQMLEALRRRFA